MAIHARDRAICRSVKTSMAPLPMRDCQIMRRMEKSVGGTDDLLIAVPFPTGECRVAHIAGHAQTAPRMQFALARSSDCIISAANITALRHNRVTRRLGAEYLQAGRWKPCQRAPTAITETFARYTLPPLPVLSCPIAKLRPARVAVAIVQAIGGHHPFPLWHTARVRNGG